VSLNDHDFSGTKTVIIGGSSGIGLAIAEQIIVRNGQVVIAGRSKDKLNSSLTKLGNNAKGIIVDITNFASLPAFFNEIGNFDNLIITSTQTLFKPFAELASEEVLSMINTKLLGSLFAAQAAVKFISKSGSILFFGGVVGQKAMKNGSVVALINSGLEGLTRSLALEIAPIRVNIIAPGIVDTGRFDNLSLDEKQKAKVNSSISIPLQRIGEPVDLANASIMVLANKFITGSVLRVDGGGQL
jgi:NAD(P)-dependent dehydrogenase (short-subunit alcohol dehydrogenase family)